jgi:putative ABC transport system permease protein
MTFAIRTAIPPMSLLTTLRRELDAYERDLPVFGFTTLKDVVEKSLAQERLFAALSSLFGLVALALAVVGLYGVMAYSVSQRTREIGLRIALGARSRSALSLIAARNEGHRRVSGGAPAFGLTRIIASRLYESPRPTLGRCVGACNCTGCVAGLLSSMPRGAVDPMEALP